MSKSKTGSEKPVQKSYLTPQNPQNPQKGGRPSEVVYVNPEYIKWKGAGK